MIYSAIRMLTSDNFSLPIFFMMILSSIFVVMVTLPVHEYAHARTAYQLGDPTAKYQGRMTLNPFAHFDPIGTTMILLFGFGWAKGVPVNQMNFRNRKKDMALVGAAGPIANLIMAIILTFLCNLFYFLCYKFIPVSIGFANALYYISLFCFFSADINIVLAVFNLIPFPPLDGSRIFYAVLPDRLYYKLQYYERYLFVVVMVLAVSGAFSATIGFVGDKIFAAINWLCGLPFGNFAFVL